MKALLVFCFFVLSTMAKINAQSGPLNEIQTKAVFDLVFGSGSSAGMAINDEDKKHAKLFLKELVEKSCAMSGAEALTTSYLYNSNLIGYVKELISSVYSNCYEGTKEGKYYDSVRKTLARNWKSAFEVRKQTNEW